MDSRPYFLYHLLNLIRWNIFVLICVLRHILAFLLTYVALSLGRDTPTKSNLSGRLCGSMCMAAVDMAICGRWCFIHIDDIVNEFLSCANKIMKFGRFFQFLWIRHHTIMVFELMMDVLNQLLHIFLLVQAYWFVIRLKVLVYHLIDFLVSHL